MIEILHLTYCSEQYRILAPGVKICFSQVALINSQPSPLQHRQGRATMPRCVYMYVPELQEARHAALLVLDMLCFLLAAAGLLAPARPRLGVRVVVLAMRLGAGVIITCASSQWGSLGRSSMRREQFAALGLGPRMLRAVGHWAAGCETRRREGLPSGLCRLRRGQRDLAGRIRCRRALAVAAVCDWEGGRSRMGAR